MEITDHATNNDGGLRVAPRGGLAAPFPYAVRDGLPVGRSAPGKRPLIPFHQEKSIRFKG